MRNNISLLQGESNNFRIIDNADLKKYEAIFYTCKATLAKIDGSQTCIQIKEIIKRSQEMLDFNMRFKENNDQQQTKLHEQSIRLKAKSVEFQRAKEESQRVEEENRRLKEENRMIKEESRKTKEENKRMKEENRMLQEESQQIKQESKHLRMQMKEIKALNVENLSKILKYEYQDQIHRLVDDNIIQDDRVAQLMKDHQCDLSFKVISQALQKYKNEIKTEASDILDHLEHANIKQVMRDCEQIRYRLEYFLNQIDSSKKIMERASHFFQQRANDHIKEGFYTMKHEIETMFQKGVIRLIDMAAIHCTNCKNCCLKNHEQQETLELMGHDLY